MHLLFVALAVVLVGLGVGLMVRGVAAIARSGWPPRAGRGPLEGALTGRLLVAMMSGRLEVPTDRAPEVTVAAGQVRAQFRGSQLFALGTALGFMGPALLSGLGADLLGLWVVVNVPVLWFGRARDRAARRYLEGARAPG